MPPHHIVIAIVPAPYLHDDSTVTHYHSRVLYFNNSEFPMVNRTGYKSKTKKRTPKTTRTEMSNIEKGMIIGFFYCLRNIALVAQITGRPWTTIKSFLARPCECQSLDNVPRPGRTPTLSKLQRRTIIQEAKSNRKMTRSDFRKTYALGVSRSTGNTNSLYPE